MQYKDIKEMNVPFGDNRLFNDLIFESIPLGVIFLSPERKILKFNSKAEKITGYKADEAQGVFCGDILHGGYCLSNCPIQKILKKEKKVIRVETTIQTRDNQFLPVAMTTAATFDRDGRLLGAVEVLEDVSRLKRLEKDRLNLLYMIAHDMKSPLESIGGFSTRLMYKNRENLSSQQLRYLEIIKGETDKLDVMVNELAEFSRLEEGQLNLDINSISLDKLLIELVETYHPLVAERGVELHLDLTGNSAIIQADEARLRRAFTNLLDNALKFSEQSGTITIRIKENSNEWIILVKDEGIGIEPEELPYIFGAFFRGKRTEYVEGSGLGLAIVKAIVEGHGGRVVVESEPGKGATFMIHLPKAEFKEKNTSPF